MSLFPPPFWWIGSLFLHCPNLLGRETRNQERTISYPACNEKLKPPLQPSSFHSHSSLLAPLLYSCFVTPGNKLSCALKKSLKVWSLVISVAECWQQAEHCLCITWLAALPIPNNLVFLVEIPVAAPQGCLSETFGERPKEISPSFLMNSSHESVSPTFSNSLYQLKKVAVFHSLLMTLWMGKKIIQLIGGMNLSCDGYSFWSSIPLMHHCFLAWTWRKSSCGGGKGRFLEEGVADRMLLLLDKICPVDNREDPIKPRLSYQPSSMLPIRGGRPNFDSSCQEKAFK